MAGPHIVVAGDTLHDIAAKYGVETTDLIAWNDLDNPDLIHSGDEIVVEMPDVHVVEQGDTLKDIAARYGLELADVIAWNELENPDLIHPGDEIRLTGETT